VTSNSYLSKVRCSKSQMWPGPNFDSEPPSPTACLHSANAISALNAASSNHLDHLDPSGHNQARIKRHGRAILTNEQAQAIFRHKPTASTKDRSKASVLSRIYGVSIKAVRDIWVGRTWYRATFHMDHSKPFSPERLEKKAGRPSGCKDSVPRARKIPSDPRQKAQVSSENTTNRPAWMDFPMIPAEGFEDPFRGDWEMALQVNEQSWSID
jgi:hypothetical protein